MRIQNKLGAILRAKMVTLSVAESCTGGLTSHLITEVPGSSDYFLGGVVAYGNTAKLRPLGVSRQSLNRYGAVSATVARQMAVNVKKLFSADYGMGITGIAGPGGGSSRKPVGLVFIAIATPQKVLVRKFHFLGTRAEIKFSSAQRALNLLRLSLL